MKDFDWHLPTHLIFGKTALDKLSQKAKIFGNKIMLVYGGGSIKRNGIYEKVKNALKDFEVSEFGGIEPNPRVETVRKAIEVVRSVNPDLLLAVGGGSVIDATKLIAAATHYSGDAWDFLTGNPQPSKFIPIGVVLTLAATASENNGGAVITNWERHEKLFFEREELLPQFSILNPEFTFTVNAEQTAYGAIDAFTHVIEQYINTTVDSPLQDRFSEALLKTIIEEGPKALTNPQDYNARANLMLAASFALNGMIVMGVGQDWATHNIEHELSAFYDIPHAAGLAILLPNWMRVVKGQKQTKLAQYARNIWKLEGTDDELATTAADKTEAFFNSLEVKPKLKDWNITDEHFKTIVGRLEGKIGEISLNADEINEILSKSLA